jgi:hypothetical protein
MEIGHSVKQEVGILISQSWAIALMLIRVTPAPSSLTPGSPWPVNSQSNGGWTLQERSALSDFLPRQLRGRPLDWFGVARRNAKGWNRKLAVSAKTSRVRELSTGRFGRSATAIMSSALVLVQPPPRCLKCTRRRLAEAGWSQRYSHLSVSHPGGRTSGVCPFQGETQIELPRAGRVCPPATVGLAFDARLLMATHLA